MKKITRGTGITARDINVFENQEEQKADAYAFIEFFSKHENWFERIVSGIEPHVLHVTADFDSDSTIVEDDSEMDFALRIRSLIRTIRSAISKNDIDETARWSLQLGEVFAEVRIKYGWEKYALSGKRHSESQSEKGKKSAKLRWSGDDRKALADIVIKLAKRKDAIGDYEPPSELWTLLYSQLEDNELNPSEHKGDKITEYFYTYGQHMKKITYRNFCKQIERARQK